jgi:hypothetical protein
MSKDIPHTFRFQLTEKQYRIIAKEFQSCQLGTAAMIGQPAIWFGGQTHTREKPPMMEMAVISPSLFRKLENVLLNRKK